MPAKVLRAPFQYAAKAGAFTADKVNTAVDMSIDSAKSGLDSVMEHKYVSTVTKQITTFQKEGMKKVAPFTSKAKPFVQPVVPYIEKAKPYVPAGVLTVLALSTPPVLLCCAIVAFITAPIWMFVGLITSLIWVPALIVFGALAITLGTFLAFVFGIRYASSPAGQAKLTKYWKKISSTPMGQKVFFIQ